MVMIWDMIRRLLNVSCFFVETAQHSYMLQKDLTQKKGVKYI